MRKTSRRVKERDISEKSFVGAMIRTCILAGILPGLAALGLAQEKPDFSGEWILDRQASTLSPLASAYQSGVARIEHRDPLFRYSATLVSESGPLKYAFELRSDGREVGSAQQGMTSVSSLRWEGEALVMTSVIQRAGDAELRISFRYELIDDGRRLRAVERVRGGLRDQDNIWMFARN
jgi:hypothetical protein